MSQITDDMVERAVDAYWGMNTLKDLGGDAAEVAKASMRRALESALSSQAVAAKPVAWIAVNKSNSNKLWLAQPNEPEDVAWHAAIPVFASPPEPQDGWQPMPRGGVETDWQAASIEQYRKYRKLAKAAAKVVEEVDRIHDNEPWPQKYRAPWEAITGLRNVLSTQRYWVANELLAAPPKPEATE